MTWDQWVNRLVFSMAVSGATVMAYVATDSATAAVSVWVATMFAAVAIILLIEDGHL